MSFLPSPSTVSLGRFWYALAAAVLVSTAGSVSAVETYELPDPDLKIIQLDTAPTESFLAVRADTEGRLFVGGREALYVYEPDEKGGYAPRREILHFPDHTWVYDIEIRGQDLYLLTVSALYRVAGGRVKREGLVAERLIWGVPLGHVHQCFHGLTWGPEGDLYFAMGDPLWYYGDFNRPDHWGYWTFFSRPGSQQDQAKPASAEKWVKTPYTGVGGVFRCKPDGSGLRIVSRGLRNSCGLVFDRNWNLFTNDNDHESMPAEYVPGRLNHVTPHSYFGWPRGWMLSKTPDRADLLETMLTTMGRAVPVGQSYYDETYLPEKYRNNLLVARWCTRKLTRYPLQHHGATFKTEELELLNCRDLARPVGVSVGRGGRIFSTVCYMAQNEGSPTYQSDLVMITRADDPETHPHDSFDATTALPEKLWSELSNPSWWPRYRAHAEILRRGGELLAAAVSRLEQVEATDPAIQHLPWLAAATRTPAAEKLLIELAAHPEPLIRLAVIRALGEFYPGESSRGTFVTALADSNAQVRQAAVTAFFDRKNIPLADPHFIECARSQDTYIRQATTLLLAEQATIAELKRLSGAADRATRLAGVLAAGFRLTLPPATEPLAENLPVEKWQSAEAYTIQFADRKVDLREHGRLGTFTVADHWKAGSHTPEQADLFAVLAARLDDTDERVRLQAAHFLYLLNDSRTEPKIAEIRSENQKQRLGVAPLKLIDKAWLAGPFSDGEQGFAVSHPPESGLINLDAKYRVSGKEVSWQTVSTMRQYNFRKLYGDCDRSSFYAYFRLESASRQPANLLVGSDDGVRVWQNGKQIWSNEIIRGALPTQDVVPLELQPGGNDFLVRVQNVSGDSGLYLHYRALAPLVHSLPEKLGISTLAERLQAAAADPAGAKLDPVFLTTDWTTAASQGDAERGRKLFSAAGMGCAKCHGVTADAAGNGGPSLAEAVKRFTIPHLVESILLPNKQVSPVFKATLVVTTNGKQFTGLVVGETAEKLELVLTDANRLTIPKGDIEDRKLQDISPMPQGIVKTPAELRDLLAYLLSENPKAP